jgi:predicted TIM-barrel fold metal-dependent hydrolase
VTAANGSLTVVDSHVHFWDPFTLPGPSKDAAELYRTQPEDALRLFHENADEAHRALVRTPKYLYQPYLPETLVADAGTTEVTGVVHVQSGRQYTDPVDETRWVASLPFGESGRPDLVGIVGLADPRHPEFGVLLDRHCDVSDAFRGIRLMTTHHPDAGVVSSTPGPGALASSEFLSGFEALAKRGLTFDAWVFSHQLDDVITLAREYPETTIVLDHLGTPVGAAGPYGRSTGTTRQDRAAIVTAWRDRLAELSTAPNVVVKASGIAFSALGHNEAMSAQDLAYAVVYLLETVVSVFGEDRVMFGSNYPIDKPLASYNAVVEALRSTVAPLGGSVLRKVLSGNALAVYGTDAATDVDVRQVSEI